MTPTSIIYVWLNGERTCFIITAVLFARDRISVYVGMYHAHVTRDHGGLLSLQETDKRLPCAFATFSWIKIKLVAAAISTDSWGMIVLDHLVQAKQA